MIVKCLFCKKPKDEDEVDMCETCCENTCFDCAPKQCCDKYDREEPKEETEE